MPSAPRTARAIARAELTRAILDRATAQLADIGPAGLSVRAVARDLGMAASAIYRYFPNRDALLTALIVDAFDDMGAAVETAESARPRDDLTGRWRALTAALRSWALANPHRYALTYGSPVPGYAASDVTVVPAARVAVVIVALMRDAEATGATPAPGPPVDAIEAEAIAPISHLIDPPLPPAHTARALLAWSAVFGHISLELFGHMHEGVVDPATHFAHLTDQLAHDLGFDL